MITSSVERTVMTLSDAAANKAVTIRALFRITQKPDHEIETIITMTTFVILIW